MYEIENFRKFLDFFSKFFEIFFFPQGFMYEIKKIEKCQKSKKNKFFNFLYFESKIYQKYDLINLTRFKPLLLIFSQNGHFLKKVKKVDFLTPPKRQKFLDFGRTRHDA